jgi:hypothetical protein
MAFAAFREIEALNPEFHAGHAKMRVTVDTEVMPRRPEDEVLAELAGAYPGLRRHQCRSAAALGGAPAGGTRILLVPEDASANQAHVFEHLTLEILGALDDVASRLSGVTCAYADPPERNDVFVECDDADTGSFAAWLAVDIMNGVLAGAPATPLYADVLRCARLMHESPSQAWTPPLLARNGDMPETRAEAALAVLSQARLVQSVEYAMNFSGEPHYRRIAAGARAAWPGADERKDEAG